MTASSQFSMLHQVTYQDPVSNKQTEPEQKKNVELHNFMTLNDSHYFDK